MRGLIAFDDIIEPQPIPGNPFHPFWERLEPTVSHRKFIHRPDQRGFGIGLVQVPRE